MMLNLVMKYQEESRGHETLQIAKLSQGISDARFWPVADAAVLRKSCQLAAFSSGLISHTVAISFYRFCNLIARSCPNWIVLSFILECQSDIHYAPYDFDSARF